MDPVSEIKARLPIEELVGRYCQLQKKGRGFVTLCPFHNDSHPSMQVSPDKGIAYCFACQSGGDIFSFHQKIEGVDFPQALKDLAERTGVELPREKRSGPSKDEKQQVRSCLEEALRFYRGQLLANPQALGYLEKRGVGEGLRTQFQLGYAPDSFSATYEHLLKAGFSRKEILAAGLGVQKELREERIYDRFRHRLLFPIHDGSGGLIGFGGRTLGDDPAKYINSPEGPLYRKSSVLFGLHHARESVREKGNILVVEGYFDLLACHRAGVRHVVATSGTALTEEHARILRRLSPSVSLCFDSDQAGRGAAERAFLLLSKEGLQVSAITLPFKDPDEAAVADVAALSEALERGGEPYLDAVLGEFRRMDLTSPFTRREAIGRLLPLLSALPLAVEREAYIAKAAGAFRATQRAFEEDVRAFQAAGARPAPMVAHTPARELFSKAEVSLALFLLHPSCRSILPELIPPEEEFGAALYDALKGAPPEGDAPIEQFIAPEHRERAAILLLYAEEHEFCDWSDAVALREVRRNCQAANREHVRRKMHEISQQLLQARTREDPQEQALLEVQYQEILKVARMVG